MSVAGGFFEVTGERAELWRIFDGIERNQGRETSGASASLDLWQEMLDEWFIEHDRKVAFDAWETCSARWVELNPGVPVIPEVEA